MADGRVDIQELAGMTPQAGGPKRRRTGGMIWVSTATMQGVRDICKATGTSQGLVADALIRAGIEVYEELRAGQGETAKPVEDADA